jgi:hypothetical protein
MKSQYCNTGISSILLLSMVVLGLLIVAGGWWILQGRHASDSRFSASEQELLEMRAELRELRREIEALREAQLQQVDLYDRKDREPFLAGMAGEPETGDPAKASLMKSKGKDQGGQAADMDYYAAFADAKRLGSIEDPAERLALARELLESPNAWARSRAILALLETDPAAGIEAIYGLLDMAGEDAEGKGPYSASRAVEALGDVEGYPVANDLYRMYESEIEGVSLAAARALERQGDPTLIDRELNRYAQQLGAVEPRARLEAIWRIGETGSPRAVPHLLPLLSNPDPMMRIGALDALGGTMDPAHIAEIERLLDDPVAAVRDRAVDALNRMQKRREDK